MLKKSSRAGEGQGARSATTETYQWDRRESEHRATRAYDRAVDLCSVFLSLSKVPSSAWMRQRIDAKGAELRDACSELSVRLLQRTEAPIAAHQGYVCCDIDTFVMDNSDTKKESVGRTYQGVDGYPPIAAYLGNEGWNIGFELCAGKHVGLLDLSIERAWQKAKRNFRLVVQVTERTIDKNGQCLLVPEVEMQGGWTRLDVPAEEVIELYKHHGTHEQFHSEIKNDLDLERLPSDKFATHDAIVHLAAFAYNGLRLLGQPGLTGEIVPIRHPAKRRRLKTVLHEILYRAVKFVAHARQQILGFGRGFAGHGQVFAALQERLLSAASP